MYEKLKTGSKYTSSYKLYITKNSEIISPWHDISPFSGEHIVCVNEIPRFSNAKFEISKSDPFNPIKQDIKKGNPRFVQNIFPSTGYPWNYGAIPQTFEDPNEPDTMCNNVKGDNDPLDVIEIGSKGKESGEVYTAKVLGCLALLDDGECDWKIIVIDINDELADKMNDINDVKEHCPSLIELTINWFRDYKIPDGKGQNEFALEGQCMNREFAWNVIKKANESYNKLMMAREDNKIWYEKDGNENIQREDGPDEKIPGILGGYFYVKK